LTDAAAAFTTHIWEVPQQIRKQMDETKSAGKAQQKLLEEIAALHADKLLAEKAEQNGFRLVAQTFADRDPNFVKFLAHKLTADSSRKAVALLASTANQPTLVFGCTAGVDLDMGALLKDAVTARGGRGGGSKEMAQGGVPSAAEAQSAVDETAKKISGG
jgi:alanyl-tRNA synthetase